MNGTVNRLLALSPATLGILSNLSSLQIQRVSVDSVTRGRKAILRLTNNTGAGIGMRTVDFLSQAEDFGFL